MSANLFNTYTGGDGSFAKSNAKLSALTGDATYSLVFDTKRHSIWTQGTEYGYGFNKLTKTNTGDLPSDALVQNITATDGVISVTYVGASTLNVTYANGAGNADTLDSIHADGLLTDVSFTNDTSNKTKISVTVGTHEEHDSLEIAYASTAGKWKTARNIYIQDSDGTNTGSAVSVDGSAIPYLKLPSAIKANITGNVTGNADTASKWNSNRSFTITDGTHTSTGVNVDGSQDITLNLPSKIKVSTLESTSYTIVGNKLTVSSGGADITGNTTLNNNLTVKGVTYANKGVERTSGGQWKLGYTNAVVKQNGVVGSSWNPVIAQKTPSGDWTFGNLGQEEQMRLIYFTDDQHANDNNTTPYNTPTYSIQFPLKTGTIALLSDNVASATSATTATNLTANPSIQAGTTDTNKVTITAGGKTSSEFTIPFATNATNATTATNLANKPSIQAGTTDTNKVTITAGGKTSSEFTIPYATNAGKLGGTAKDGLLTNVSLWNSGNYVYMSATVGGHTEKDYVEVAYAGSSNFAYLSYYAVQAGQADNAQSANNADYASNSDKVDGYHAGNSSGQVPISNGTKNTNLNADLLDGKHLNEVISGVSLWNSGNYLYMSVSYGDATKQDYVEVAYAGSSNFAYLSYYAVQAGQVENANYASTANYANNSDKVDGYDAGNGSGQVAVSNGTKNTNLNADLLDGYHIAVVSGSLPSTTSSNTIYLVI